ncbi:MAG: helix-turn-helix transcriptional regulator [[Pasteurella] aerogenes]|nr:helix-turn-helix transcriptional regulator [[Pasteurella] aerogenes]
MAQLPPKSFDKLIGKRIQIKRRELHYSAEQLSEYVGISQQQLSRYERGTNKINVTHLINIATYLNTPIEWFFADCLSVTNHSHHLDQYWHQLNEEQKLALVGFLKTL